MDLAARIEAQDAVIQRLRDRITELEEELGVSLTDGWKLGLSPAEARMFGVLDERGAASKSTLWFAGARTHGDTHDTEMKIVDVLICKARAKLKRFGIEIQTVWGQGYAMSLEHRALARQIMGLEPVAEAVA